MTHFIYLKFNKSFIKSLMFYKKKLLTNWHFKNDYILFIRRFNKSFNKNIDQLTIKNAVNYYILFV